MITYSSVTFILVSPPMSSTMYVVPTLNSWKEEFRWSDFVGIFIQYIDAASGSNANDNC